MFKSYPFVPDFGATHHQKLTPFPRGSARMVFLRKLFISHATRDLPRLRGLVHLLEAIGHECFVASSDIPAGRNWRRYLREALRSCDACVVLWTRGSAESEWVEQEYEYYQSAHPGRPIIPLHVDLAVPLPETLASRQSIMLPLLQDVISECHWSRSIGSDSDHDEAMRSIKETLERYEVDLSERKRREILLFVSGAGAGAGLLTSLLFSRRYSTFLAVGNKKAVGYVVGSCACAAVASAAVKPSSQPVRSGTSEPPSLGVPSRPRFDSHPLPVPLKLLEPQDVEDYFPRPGTPSEQKYKPRLLPGLCKNVDDAIADGRGRRFPEEVGLATKKYAMPYFHACFLSRASLVPFALDFICEEAQINDEGARNYLKDLSLSLSTCTPLSSWSGARSTGDATSFACEGSSVQLEVGECKGEDGRSCASVRVRLSGESSSCL